MNNTLNIAAFKTESFEKNFDKNSCAVQYYNICALCGKPCKTWKFSLLFAGSLNEAVLVNGKEALEKMLLGSPIGFYAVGSDCVRRLTPEAKAFLYTEGEQVAGKNA